MKNKKFFLTFFLFSFLIFVNNSFGEEFYFETPEIQTFEEGNLFIASKGGKVITDNKIEIFADKFEYNKKFSRLIANNNVKVIDSLNKVVIKADNIIYLKNEEKVTAKNNVEVIDNLNKIVIKADNIVYLKNEEKVLTEGKTNITVEDKYIINSKDIVLLRNEKKINSDKHTSVFDNNDNYYTAEKFRYLIEKKLFRGKNVSLVSNEGDKYFFEDVLVNLETDEIHGKDIEVNFKKNTFDNENNEPRLKGNKAHSNQNETIVSKASFTTCKKRPDNKCPPWIMEAKEARHDKIKKTIYYENAVLKVYDVPVFYFPAFFHPAPDVKRQSGFLAPFFTTSTAIGNGFALPYFWAISHDKDLTFTPKTYAKENLLFLNEYRQAFKNGSLTLDGSFTEGYKNTSATKTDGSRNHIFGELNLNFAKNENYISNLFVKSQRVSNDTFFRVHDIDTALVDSENTDLKNEINYNYGKDNMYLNISGVIYENLRDKNNSRYEYVLPNILYGKSLFTEKYGVVNFEANAYHKTYSVNKHTTFLNNDVVWNSNNLITKKGLVNTFGAMFSNQNYKAENTTNYKTQGTVNELNSVYTFKSAFPLKKETSTNSNMFSPNFMLRYAPGHMRNLSGDSVTLNYANLYSTNKTALIEDGLNAILGFDYQLNKKNKEGNEENKLSISMGQIFSRKENKDMPVKSSLHRKTSDIVGDVNYNFSKIGNVNYKFSLDHNLNDLNYNEVSTTLNFGKVGFNLDYLEETNHVGREHFVNTGIDLTFNERNKLSLSTKKNYKTDSTEYYDMSYQYTLDCLTAGVMYRREYYEDSDVEQKNNLMFTIKFIPFGGVRTPVFNP